MMRGPSDPCPVLNNCQSYSSMARPIITQLFKLVPAPPAGTYIEKTRYEDDDFGGTAEDGEQQHQKLLLNVAPQHNQQNGKQRKGQGGDRETTTNSSKFKFDPSVHSTAEWTQSLRYGRFFDILCLDGVPTNFVVCKLCQARFAKRSTDSLKSHATEHGFNLGMKDEQLDGNEPDLNPTKRRSNKKLNSEFKYDPTIHSMAEWTQSSVYGQHFRILLEQGRPTDHVLCKICRARFTKRSTDSMRIHLAKHRERCEVDTRSAMEASLAKFMAFTGQPASLVDNSTFVDFLRHYELHCHQRRELGESVDPRCVLPSVAKMTEQIVHQGFHDLSRSLYR